MNQSTQFFNFCAFFVSEMIVMFGTYIGAQMRHFFVVEVGIVAAVVALIGYTAATAAIEMNRQDKENGHGGQSGQCEG